MSSYFFRNWSATCAKCGSQFTHDNFDCKNCGKGKILADGGGGVQAVHFGCPVCGEICLRINCPKCNAIVNEQSMTFNLALGKLSKLMGCRTLVKIVVIFWIVIIFLGICLMILKNGFHW